MPCQGSQITKQKSFKIFQTKVLFLKERTTLTKINAKKIGVLDAAIGAATGVLGINRGTWKGSLPAWGMRRIWLKPDSDANTYERDGFTIHGGFSKGSAGCIDIPWQTGTLSDYMDNCQESVPVYVGYPKDNW